MKEIPLTQDQVALVDDEDFEWLMQWRWYADWESNTRSYYAGRHERLPDGKQTTVKMHREVLGLERGDKRQGDHVNHDTLDNRRENLRIATNQQNQFNRKRPTKGYRWDKRSKKYQAYIQVGGVQKHLGLFDTPEQARAAYLAAKAEYYKIHNGTPTGGETSHE